MPAWNYRPRQRPTTEFKNVIRPCRQCGESLVLRNARDVQRKFYCSRVCLGRHLSPDENLEVGDIRKCKKCGDEFTARRARHLYCSIECQTRVATEKYKIRFNTIDGFLRRLVRPTHRPELGFEFVRLLFDRQMGRCAISGVEMTCRIGAGCVWTNVSIDKINSKRGYTKDNVQLVCYIVNYMKRDMSMDQLRMWCARVTENAHASGFATAV